jgi:hypothetical protein
MNSISIFRDFRFATMISLIDNVLNTDVNYTKSIQEMRYQEGFAVKSGVDGLLDAARRSFLQSVEDINNVRIFSMIHISSQLNIDWVTPLLLSHSSFFITC